MKRFLITTADESTWKTDTPVLFLGEWCKRYNRKEIWAGLNYETVKYHWDDREKLLKDYTYLSNLYEEVLSNLSNQLNEIHSVDHSLRYWRILIGPWLGPFIQMTFDRWTMVQKAVNEYDISETYILENDIFNNIPYDISHFREVFSEDGWNRSIFSYIIENWTDINYIKIHSCKFSNANQSIEDSSKKIIKGPKNSINKKLKFFPKFIIKPKDGLFFGAYYPLYETLKINIKLKQIPWQWKKNQPVMIRPDLSQRNWIFKRETNSEYEKALQSLIPLQIPTDYLEGYSDLIQQVSNLIWSDTPRFILTSVSHIGDDIFKAWTAEKVESGSSLIISQHGGHYGSVQFSFQEDHEIKICDKFFSWGWTSHQTDKVIPMNANKLMGKKDLKWNPKGKALLVSGAKPRYSYWLYSTYIAGQWLDFFQDQCLFLQNLPKNIQEMTIVRLYPHDFGWDQDLRWKEQFPTIQIEDGHSGIKVLKQNCRVVISTYNATTFLETMAQNIPTIFFWNPDQSELRAKAEPFFEELLKVGIFHKTPESAAKKLLEIWDDVGLWWYAKETQAIRKNFCHQFARFSENSISKLYETLKEG